MKLGWYPGHMNKARRKLGELLPTVDVIIEVVDARLPHASANPIVAEHAQKKPLLRILNKIDLADPNITALWLQKLKSENFVTMGLSANRPKETDKVIKQARKLAPSRDGKSLRAVIVGIPNVGKSTLINALAGKRIARVGDEPAVTKAQQRVKARGDLQIIDTPGMLWPNLSDQVAAHRLAASGGIRDTVYDYEEIAKFTVKWLQERYPKALCERYKLDNADGEALDVMGRIGAKRGCLRKGGELDLQKVAELILREVRSGKMGRVSFERPNDID